MSASESRSTPPGRLRAAERASASAKESATRYAELAAKVDGFFARVEARHGDQLACRTGCSDCCHTRLSVTRVEADAIRAELAGRRITLDADPAHCAALDAAGRCQIYAARPFVCRSHGAPIRLREHSLPVVTACFRNFTAAGPAAADPDCVLDQTTLSALVLAVNGGDDERVDLAALLASLC